MLDLSAAFDTVDHNQLLSVFESEFSVTDKVLSCFSSYIKERTHRVKIGPDYLHLKCGVLQGSVLGTIMFILLTTSLRRIFKKYNVFYHNTLMTSSYMYMWYLILVYQVTESGRFVVWRHVSRRLDCGWRADDRSWMMKRQNWQLSCLHTARRHIVSVTSLLGNLRSRQLPMYATLVLRWTVICPCRTKWALYVSHLTSTFTDCHQ